MPDSQYPFLGPPARPGDLGTLGDYRIVRLLGEGGMGYVFRGEDDRLGRAVAVKVMKPAIAAKPQAKQRFFREGRAAAAVKSDYVVIIHAVGEAGGGVPFLVMEHLEGQPLDAWLRDRGDLAQVPFVVQAGQDALSGLAAAHNCGLVHRDIKPGNLWVESPSGRVKVLDFGLTRSVENAESFTVKGMLLGTPAYMAPEQVKNSAVDARADLFSLGVVMFHMLTGSSPFDEGNIYSSLFAVTNKHPKLPAHVPGPLAKFIMTLLCKDSAGRPADAVTARTELTAAAYRMGLGTPTVPLLESSRPTKTSSVAILSDSKPNRRPVAIASPSIITDSHKNASRSNVNNIAIARGEPEILHNKRPVTELRGCLKVLWKMLTTLFVLGMLYICGGMSLMAFRAMM